MRRTRQSSLELGYVNPLKERMTKEFFRELPKEPGVYLMLDAGGSIIYVGKAKNLHQRLSSYKYAKPGKAAPKVLRLLAGVREIRIERYADERAALLRENDLLRRYKPLYNKLNTRPESYYFIGLEEKGDDLIVRLTAGMPVAEPGVWYGAFKGHRNVQRACIALVRFTAVEAGGIDNHRGLPVRLSGRIAPAVTTVCNAGIAAPADLLAGASPRFLVDAWRALLRAQSTDRFLAGILRDDLVNLSAFYQRAARRIAALREEFGFEGTYIPGPELDDLLAARRAKR